jgi:uncharacterized repeat protein (TIGR03803 family)
MKKLLHKVAIGLVLILAFYTVQAQHSEFYGMMPTGGEFNYGTVFKTDGNGNDFQIVSNFRPPCTASYPMGDICEADNGKFYGVTSAGGSFNMGVIFEFDPANGIFTEIFSFNGEESGRIPLGSLIQASNGKLYGTTGHGGVNNKGVLFEWDLLANSYSKKVDFGDSIGGIPYRAMLQADNGKLYGMTSSGGMYGNGVLFEWDPETEIFKKLLDFDGENGRMPMGSLIQLHSGKLFGMTSGGGTDEKGVLFEFDIATGAYSKRLDFNGENGQNPEGSLFLARSGKLYAVTFEGGAYNMGVIFEWDPDLNTYTKKIDFQWNDGAKPVGKLEQADNGKLYGLTRSGGTNNWGVLFEWDPETNTYSKKIDFDEKNGLYPRNSLVKAGNGKLFGMTGEGGVYNMGVLFEWYAESGIYTKILDFNKSGNGRYPTGTLVRINTGKLYGMTQQGGSSNLGVIFEVNPGNNTFMKKFDFAMPENGKWPVGSLVQADNGKLYGMAGAGGYNANTPDYGVLFEWDPVANTYMKKFAFDGESHGRFPTGTLVKTENGKLYGMTVDGGIYTHFIHDMPFGNGVIFEYDPASDTFTKKFDFNGSEYGSTPYGYLVLANNGKLYGMTLKGGENDMGILFEWNPSTGTFYKILDFNGQENGSQPLGSLVQANNGKLYGMTLSGGEYDHGIIFEVDPDTHLFVKKFEFNDAINGIHPNGALLQASNGKFYGKAGGGGAYNAGVLFEWDPITNIYTKKLDVGGQGTFQKSASQKEEDPFTINERKMANNNGNIEYDEPVGAFINGLMEIIHDTYNTITTVACDEYISPSGKHTWTMSGAYKDTIPNAAGYDSILNVNLTIKKVDISVTGYPDSFVASASDAAYQWIDCDNGNVIIEGEIFQTINAIFHRNYAVIVKQNECIDTSDCYTLLADNANNSFKNLVLIYPNPNTGKFSIDLGRVYPLACVSITELDGRLIQTEQRPNIRIINIKMNDGTVPGVYLLKISTGNERAVFRIVMD